MISSATSLGAGVIISPSYLLTCAHNVAFYDGNTFKTAEPNSVWLYFGAHKSWYRQSVPNAINIDREIQIGLLIPPVPEKDLIEEFFIHPNWDDKRSGPPLFDIALVKLKIPLQFSDTIRPICLPASTETLYENKWAKAIGWGTTTSM